MTHRTKFTAAEATFILGEPTRTPESPLDDGTVRPVLPRGGDASERAIEWQELFFLYAARTLRDHLSPKALLELHETLPQSPVKSTGEVQFGRFRIALHDLIKEVDQRITDLALLADAVEFRSNGEPLLSGTSVEVYRISALLAGGASVDQVLEDYPSLSRPQVEAARAYAETYPKPGRPYAHTSVKRALRSAGLEALDDFL